MTSTPNILTAELRDLLYNQCIDNMSCYSIFIYSAGRIMVCKIRFVSTGENRRKPCLVCKKRMSLSIAVRDVSVSACLSHPRIKLLSNRPSLLYIDAQNYFYDICSWAATAFIRIL